MRKLLSSLIYAIDETNDNGDATFTCISAVKNLVKFLPARKDNNNNVAFPEIGRMLGCLHRCVLRVYENLGRGGGELPKARSVVLKRKQERLRQQRLRRRAAQGNNNNAEDEDGSDSDSSDSSSSSSSVEDVVWDAEVAESVCRVGDQAVEALRDICVHYGKMGDRKLGAAFFDTTYPLAKKLLDMEHLESDRLVVANSLLLAALELTPFAFYIRPLCEQAVPAAVEHMMRAIEENKGKDPDVMHNAFYTLALVARALRFARREKEKREQLTSSEQEKQKQQQQHQQQPPQGADEEGEAAEQHDNKSGSAADQEARAKLIAEARRATLVLLDKTCTWTDEEFLPAISSHLAAALGQQHPQQQKLSKNKKGNTNSCSSSTHSRPPQKFAAAIDNACRCAFEVMQLLDTTPARKMLSNLLLPHLPLAATSHGDEAEAQIVHHQLAAMLCDEENELLGASAKMETRRAVLSALRQARGPCLKDETKELLRKLESL